jgi:uncharacterized protein (TIGR02421 family)
MMAAETPENLSENRPQKGGQAHFAVKTSQTEPTPDGTEIASKQPSPKSDAASLADEVMAVLGEDKRLRLDLPGGGRLQFDRRLPFLCVYRRRAGQVDVGTEQLVTSETAYLVVPEESRAATSALQLLRIIAEQLAGHFGGFLVIEVWSEPGAGGKEPAALLDGEAERILPRFDIVTHQTHVPRGTVEALSKSLGNSPLPLGNSSVNISPRALVSPPELKPLVRLSDLKRWNAHLLGLAIRPVYRDETTGRVFPAVLRSVRRSLNSAMKQAFFTFSRNRTSVRPSHYYALGRRSVVKSVLDIDRQLAEVDRSFDLLLQATPINAESAWREFRRGKFEKPPGFFYRPLPIDPVLLKRQLYSIPVERIEDPTLSYLFRQKQDELDRQITLLGDVDTPRFLPESLQIYGGVSDALLKQAEDLLDRVPTRSGEEAIGGQLSATDFAKRAQQELGFYQEKCPGFTASVAVREDMYAGMMVSGDQLLIGGRTRVPRRRVEALLQHEIGTHLITRYNGHVQPFQQLEVGLAGYDGLQEGLAVLAEYLVGGLSRFRMRVVAARVVAARQMLDGSSFIDTFRMLDRSFEFSQRTAYTITMRVYRGGGLTKDAVYLRGLLQILRYLREGGDLEPLFIGKVAAAHLPLIAELAMRGIIKPPALRPRYLESPDAQQKINRLRGGMTVLELLQRQVSE